MAERPWHYFTLDLAPATVEFPSQRHVFVFLFSFFGFPLFIRYWHVEKEFHMFSHFFKQSGPNIINTNT
jgi:hypothetical protein